MAQPFTPPPPVPDKDQPKFIPPPPVADATTTDQTPPKEGFGKSLLNTINPLPLLKQAVSDRSGPAAGMARAMIAPQAEQFQRAKESYNAPEGPDWPGTIGHGLAAAVPGLGPMAAHAGEQFGSGNVAGGAGTVAGMAIPFAAGKYLPRAVEAFPTAAKAGTHFDTVMNAARNEPIDITNPSDVAQRAQTSAQFGHPTPARPIRQFVKQTEPGSPPLTYEQGRPFAVSAGDLSAKAKMAGNATTRSQLAEFAQAMDEANRGAAERTGVAEPYDKAMRMYRQAKQIEGAVDAGKKFAGSTAGRAVGYGIGGGLGGALGYQLMKKLTE